MSYVHTQSLQSCSTLCDPMDCSSPGSFVHGISRARILEWVAISSSRGSSWLKDWTSVSCSSCIGRRVLYFCATWEAQLVSLAFNLLLWLNSTQSHYLMYFAIIYIFIWALLPCYFIFYFFFCYLFGIRQVCTLCLILWLVLYLSIYTICIYVAQLVKNPLAMQEIWV